MRKFIVFIGILFMSAGLFSTEASANLFSNQNDPNRVLSVDEAFLFDFSQKEDTLSLNWQIKPGYYLYQDKIALIGQESRLGQWIRPEGISHFDEFFGDVIIYRDALSLTVPVIETQNNPSVQITFQGCADRGICYPPKTIDVPLKTIALRPENNLSDGHLGVENQSHSSPVIKTQQTEQPVQNRGISIWLAFLFGLGVAFTPCVLPMYPLLVGIIAGRQKEMNRLKMGTLVFTYIQGMALSYSILGVIVALAGLKFQAALQHPAFLITISVIFIALAGSMFGFYSLQMPSKLQTKLVNLSNQQKSGSYLGVFFMGAIAGLLCSPCTTAPLSAILPFIAETKNIFRGGLTLYMYALGMGIPLMGFALFGHRLMPKAGPWMQYVKEAFGFLILALPLFLIERLISVQISELLWSLLLSACLAWALMIVIKSNTGKARVAQIVLTLALLIASLPMQQSVWQIIKDKTGFYFVSQTQTSEATHLVFQEITSIEQLTNVLESSKKNNTKVLIDYYADWCTACRQFEKYTFTDKRVQDLLADTQLIRIDVTKNNEISTQFLEYFDVLGLPALLLIDEKGKEVTRISGFMQSELFLEKLVPHY